GVTPAQCTGLGGIGVHLRVGQLGLHPGVLVQQGGHAFELSHPCLLPVQPLQPDLPIRSTFYTPVPSTGRSWFAPPGWGPHRPRAGTERWNSCSAAARATTRWLAGDPCRPWRGATSTSLADRSRR